MARTAVSMSFQGHHNDRQLEALGLELLLQFQATHSRHSNINDDTSVNKIWRHLEKR
jgi:hypothetical protein